MITYGIGHPKIGQVLQANGLIVVPMISAINVDLAKFKEVPTTWVRVVVQGEPGFALVEQIRYTDRNRCKSRIG